MWLRLARIGLVLLTAITAVAANAQERPVTEVGVSIHGIKDPRELDLMVEAGIKWVRFDLTWEKTEPKAGRYDWDAYDRLIRSITDRKLRPLILLAYSNSNYQQNVEVRKSGRSQVWSRVAAPDNEQAVEAYARWAAVAAKRYAAHKPIFELWNEPDHDFFWPPKSDPSAYSRLALRACRAIKEVAPDAYVIGPGAAEVPDGRGRFPPYLAQVLRSELPDCLDGVSLHPYLERAAIDGTMSVWNAVRNEMASSRKGKKQPELISSEWGLSTYQRRISEDERAGYLAKMLILNSVSGVPVSIWYNMRDNGDDGSVAENRFGLVDAALKPRPAWFALKGFNRLLSGATALCVRNLPGSTVQAHFRTADGQRVMAIWSQGSRSLSDIVRLGSRQPLAVLDMTGEVAAPAAAGADIRVGPQPLYVRLSDVAPAGSKDDPCN